MGVKAHNDGEAWRLEDARDIMPDLDADSPLRPFGGTEDFDISPCATRVAFAAQPGADYAWSTDINLFMAAATTTAAAAPACLTCDNTASDLTPLFSPDGRTLAYGRMAEPVFEADRVRLALLDLETRATRVVTEAWDRSVSSMAFRFDGAAVFVVAQEHGRSKLFAVDISDGATGDMGRDVRTLTSEHSVGGIVPLATPQRCAQQPPPHRPVRPDDAGVCSRVVLSRSSFYAPTEIFLLEDNDRAAGTCATLLLLSPRPPPQRERVSE